MKILYLNLDRGIPVEGDKGASVHVREFVTAAAALGHEVTLACTTRGAGNPPPPARILQFGAPPTDMSIGNEIERRERVRLDHDGLVADRICSTLARLGIEPDLVYERHALFHRAGVSIAARLGVPRILEVNAPLVEEQRRFRGLYLVDEALEAEEASYRGADAIIAVSRQVAAQVAGVIGRTDRIHVVPNGVDLARFANVDAIGAVIRARLGLAGRRIAGFIGSFKTWHGVPFLIEAIAAAAAWHPDLHLLAVGDGPEREAVAALVAKLGLANRVTLPGRIPHGEIPGWLGAMDFTVAPYLPQPDFYFSPLKIFESLAAGRAVVAPEIGEIDGIVAHGETGLLYPAGDGIALQAALSRLLADQAACQTMGWRGRQRLAGRDWRDVVRLCLALAPVRLPA